MMFHVHLADDGKEFQGARDGAAHAQPARAEERLLGRRPSTTRSTARPSSSSARRRCSPARSARRRRADETALIGEEKVRLRRHQDELRRLLKAACLSGSVYFRGNDRSPGDRAVDVGKSAAEILGQVLPEVFDRFKEAAAESNDVKKGVDALFTAENLQGLPAVFGSLGLLRDEKGKTVFRVESGAARGGARAGSRSAPTTATRRAVGSSPTSSRRSPSAGTSRSCGCSSSRCCAPERSKRPARARRSTRSPASRPATPSRTTTCSGRRRSARRRASSSRSWSRRRKPSATRSAARCAS